MKVFLLFQEYSLGGHQVSDSIILKAFLSESSAEHACAVMNENKTDAAVLYYVSSVECETK